MVGACLFVVAAFLFQLYLFRRLDIPLKGSHHVELPEDRAASTWTPREHEAWNAVQAVADKVDLSHFANWQAFLGLGQETIEAVAKSLHPEVEEALWQFTLPEALTLIEQVSLRLKPMVVHNIPFGDRLTVGQAMRIYELALAARIAQRGYDIWRIIRMLNPANGRGARASRAAFQADVQLGPGGAGQAAGARLCEGSGPGSHRPLWRPLARIARGA